MPLSIELTELYNLKGIHCKKGENIDDQTKFYKNDGSLSSYVIDTASRARLWQ